MIDLEYYDNLPVRESRKDLMFRHEFWNSWYRRSYKIEYWNIAERVIEEHIGKYFNDAFSKFKFLCKNIPEATYEYFMSYFGEKYICRRYEEYIYHRYKDFIIDNEGKIQYSEYYYSKKKNKSISITSKDFKIERIHKETKHSFDKFEEYWAKKEVTKTWKTNLGNIRSHTYKEKDEFLGYRYKGKYYIAYEKDFELVITQGWKRTFSSKRDPNYKKWLADASKPKSKNKPKKMSEQNFREILNRGKIKEKEKNDIIMIKHGFDPIISFRN